MGETHPKLGTLHPLPLFAQPLPPFDAARPNQHMIMAPGLYAGYASDPLPGIAQAIRDGDWQTAAYEVELVAQVRHARHWWGGGLGMPTVWVAPDT